MALDPFNFDVSVGADKKRRAKRRAASGAVDASARGCEWEGCQNKAAFRAPRSPQELDRFRWFCQDHIREYNKRWDYYQGLSADEIEKSRQADQRWDRPTWALKGNTHAAHSHAEGRAWERMGMADPLDVLGENATINPGDALENEKRRHRRRLIPKSDLKALEAMDLDELATRDSIRERYKTLVKQLHPDMNGGDRSEEDRLQKVIAAYNQLKKSVTFKE